MTNQYNSQTSVARRREQAAKRSQWQIHQKRLLQNAGIGVPLLIVLIGALIFAPNFATGSNIRNIIVNASILAVIGYGMTIVIAVRGIDLSVGSTQALTACVCASAVNSMGLVAGIVIAIGIGILVGAINGVIVTLFRVPGFVVTLGTLTIYRGAVLIFTDGAPILVDSSSFKNIATTTYLGIPLLLIISVILGAITLFVAARTRYGKHLVAAGVNPEAAADSGIRVNSVVLIAYAATGLAAGVAGVLLASQLGVVNGSVSTGLELQVIAIVVLGGTNLYGGRPRIIGTFVAAVLLAMINASLNLLNVPSFYQYVALGVLLIFALSMDSAQRAGLRRLAMGAA